MSSPEIPKENPRKLLRNVALFMAVTGGIASVGMTLYTGRKNPSALLMVMFAVWVLSPFAALLYVQSISKRWTAAARTLLYWLTLVTTAVSLAAYSGIWTPPGTHTAFVFLVIPFLSLAMIGIALFLLSNHKSS